MYRLSRFVGIVLTALIATKAFAVYPLQQRVSAVEQRQALQPTVTDEVAIDVLEAEVFTSADGKHKIQFWRDGNGKWLTTVTDAAFGLEVGDFPVVQIDVPLQHWALSADATWQRQKLHVVLDNKLQAGGVVIIGAVGLKGGGKLWQAILQAMVALTGLADKVPLDGDSQLVMDGGLPIGSIISYPVEKVPHGYIECNGMELLRSEYPELYHVLGEKYGARSDKGEIYFRVPDYRGVFLRAWDHGRGYDPDRDSLGTLQQDSTRMPVVPFAASLSGDHTHVMSLEGKHEHIVKEAGKHAHKVSENGEHHHLLESSGSHAHSTDSIGGHTHPVVESGKHSHSVSFAGKHNHTFVGAIKGWSKGYGAANRAEYWGDRETNDAGQHSHIIEEDGLHMHTLGTSGSHQHDLSVEGDHSHKIEDTGMHVHTIGSSGVHAHTVAVSGQHTHSNEKSGSHTHAIIGGDCETRPKNMNVVYLIKAKPISTTVKDTSASINSRPVVSQSIPTQHAVAGELFEYVVSQNTFTDADNDTLTLSATLSDGSKLPNWLEFNSDSWKFLGDPGVDDVGHFKIKVTAADPDGAKASELFFLVVRREEQSLLPQQDTTGFLKGDL